MIDVTALGELLIDFTYYGMDEKNGTMLFERNPGGAPANVAVAVSRLGRKAAFVGKVGCDMHGEFLTETLKNEGVDVTGLAADENAFTTLAFVSLNEKGERAFSFARKPGADICLTAQDIPDSVLKDTRILHFGSLSMTDEPAHGATLYAIDTAKAAGAIISYDPNDRPLLWKSREIARDTMRSVISKVDVMKISDEETELLSDAKDPAEAGARLVAQGVKIVVVTLGGDGALVCTKDGNKLVPGYRSQVADTTGAGDSFWGGFLYQLAQSGKRAEDVSLEEAAVFARFGNAVASLNVEKRGAIPAMPTMDAVEARLAEMK